MGKHFFWAFGAFGEGPSPSPTVKPKKSWSEAGLLLVTLVFTLNIYFVFIRRKLQPIKAKGQWLITLTIVGAYLLFLWTSFAVTWGAGNLICGFGFYTILLAYLLQTGPIFLRHLRNLYICFKARQMLQQNQVQLEQFLGEGGQGNSRGAFPKTFSTARQSSLVASLILVLTLCFGLQYELLAVLNRNVMVEPAVQCLSDDAYAAQGRKQSIFWFVFHLLEALAFFGTIMTRVQANYFPAEILETGHQLPIFFLVTLCQSVFFLEYGRMDHLGRVFRLTKNDMVAILMYTRITLHYLVNGLLPLTRSFSKNFQASVDSYMADALECRRKSKFIVLGAPGEDSEAAHNLHNLNDKVKYLLKDILGLEFFQRFLETRLDDRDSAEGLGHLLNWYEIETLNMKLEELSGQRNEGVEASISWAYQPNSMASQVQKIYGRLEQWNMQQNFDESVDNVASLFLSEVMERDFAQRLPNQVFLKRGSDALEDGLLKSPIKRILSSKALLDQFISQHCECILEGLYGCQVVLLLRLQEHYQVFLQGEHCQQLVNSWMMKHLIACLLIRTRVMNLPSEDSYLDLITKESLQFVVLQTLGFST